MIPANLSLSGQLSYNQGEIKDIKAEELKDNIVAIDQLINNHNLLLHERGEMKDELIQLRATSNSSLNRIEVAFLVSGVNIVAAIVMGFGINFATSDKNNSAGVLLTILGAIMVLGTSMFQIYSAHTKKKETENAQAA